MCMLMFVSHRFCVYCVSNKVDVLKTKSPRPRRSAKASAKVSVA